MEFVTKQEIAATLKQYLDEHGMSATAFAGKSGVNNSYISNILNGKFATDNGVEIKDGHFLAIAHAVGLEVHKSYWKQVLTSEFRLVVGELEKARKHTLCRTIILPTGMGKTHALERFDIRNPNHNYTVVIHDAMTLRDVVDELCEQLKIGVNGTVALKIREIIVKVRTLKRAGHLVTIKFDECENMNPQTFRAIKGLWDGLYDGKYCSLVLMGTPKLLSMLESAKKRDAAGAPQLWRRLKPGVRVVPTNLSKGLELFYKELKVTDTGLQHLLNQLCENYGELFGYLEPALREADEAAEDLTEDFFRKMYDMPKPVKR